MYVDSFEGTRDVRTFHDNPPFTEYSWSKFEFFGKARLSLPTSTVEHSKVTLAGHFTHNCAYRSTRKLQGEEET